MEPNAKTNASQNTISEATHLTLETVTCSDLESVADPTLGPVYRLHGGNSSYFNRGSPELETKHAAITPLVYGLEGKQVNTPPPLSTYDSKISPKVWFWKRRICGMSMVLFVSILAAAIVTIGGIAAGVVIGRKANGAPDGKDGAGRTTAQSTSTTA